LRFNFLWVAGNPVASAAAIRANYEQAITRCQTPALLMVKQRHFASRSLAKFIVAEFWRSPSER
jgi:hypothetical protein